MSIYTEAEVPAMDEICVKKNRRIRMNNQAIAFDQRSFLLRIYVITLSVVLLYWLLYQISPVPPYKSHTLVALGGLLLAGTLLTIRKRYIRFSSHHYILCCYSFLCFNTATSGGVQAPGAVWFLLCPLIAYLTLSRKVATFWLFTILASLCSFYFLRNYLVVDEFHGGIHWYLIAHLLLFPTVYSIIAVFQFEVSRKSRELVELNRLLEEKQNSLEISQEELICQRDHLREAEENAVGRNKKTTDYLNHLIEISRMEELHTGSLEYSIQTIQNLLMRTMSLHGVAIWHADEDSQGLNLIGSVGTDTTFSAPSPLLRESFHETLEMLESGAIITTPNENLDTTALWLPFQNMQPETSMICCPYFIEGRFAGFFSCRASNRKWSPEDVLFVRAISDALPLAFRSHQRRNQQLLLEEKQKQITELNESLERKVGERTVALKKMNEQLLNFAFINSHNIRGPICRLLGLRDLLNLTSDPEEIRTLSGLMSTSIEELDEITRKASALLADTVEE